MCVSRVMSMRAVVAQYLAASQVITAIFGLFAFPGQANGSDSNYLARSVVRRNVDVRLLPSPDEPSVRNRGYELLSKIATDLDGLDKRVDEERHELCHAVDMFDAVLPGRRRNLPEDFDERVLTLTPHFESSRRTLTIVAATPEIRIPESLDAINPRDLMPLLDYLRLESVRLCRRQQFGDAFATLEPILTVMKSVDPSHSQVVLLGRSTAIESIFTHWMRLSRHWSIDEQTLSHALDTLNGCRPSIESGMRMLSIDFRTRIESLARLPDFSASNLVVASYLGLDSIKLESIPRLIRSLGFGHVERQIRNHAAQCADVLRVLEGHPKPFDLAATLRQASDLYEEQLENLERPWHSQRRERALQLRDRIRPAAVALKLTQDVRFGLMFGGEYSGPGPGRIAYFKKQLAAVENPFGQLVLSSLDMDDQHGQFVTLFFRQRARIARIHTALALHFYNRRHGHFPERLSQLVSEKALKEIPKDPFGDRLHYSRQRGIVWSNGPDGMNHDGVDARFHNNGFEFLQNLAQTFIPPGRLRPLPPPLPEPRLPGVDRVTYFILPPLVQER